ncbi:MAG: sodium:proton antiporter [bacterium]|nr:sodium:proton antiporter [bacterium]
MATEKLIMEISSIPIIGILAQWLAWRFRVPSILLLLIGGIIVGPVLGILNPDFIYSDMILPLVSLCVAIILFEGGLGLKISELKDFGSVVRNLVFYGSIVTWIIITAAAHYILGMSYKLSVLLGAILIVTGPTVITPLLKHVHPKRHIASILKWESIIVDPVGAILAVLVYKVITAGNVEIAVSVVLLVIIKMVILGGVIGLMGALVMISLINKHMVPDFLQEAMTFVVVVAIFTVSNLIQSESGLFSVTVMGIFLANQKTIDVKNIVTFKKNLVVLLLSSVFIVLALRLKIGDLLAYIHLRSLLFILVIVFIARPAAVFISSFRSNLNFKGRLFISWMAPRGIIAAAVSGLFAMRLEKLGYSEASQLVPVTFLVIIVTVILYAFTSTYIANMLNVVQPRKYGVLVAGAQKWSRKLARILHKEGISVLLVDSNRQNVIDSRLESLPVIHGSVLSRKVLDIVESNDFGRLLALTNNDELNILASMEYSNLFGYRGIYRLPAEDKNIANIDINKGRILFGRSNTFAYLSTRFTAGADIKAIKLTKKYTFNDFMKQYPKAVPMIIITRNKHMLVYSQDKDIIPRTGQTLLSLV